MINCFQINKTNTQIHEFVRKGIVMTMTHEGKAQVDPSKIEAARLAKAQKEKAKRARTAAKVSSYVMRKVQSGETDIPAKTGRQRLAGLEANNVIDPSKAAQNEAIVKQVQHDLAEKGIRAEPYFVGEPEDRHEYRFRVAQEQVQSDPQQHRAH